MKLLICLLISLPLFVEGQTCVIAKKTKDAIYVGADSRTSIPINKNGKTIGWDTGSIRKIFSCGKINYAVIGLAGTLAIKDLLSICNSQLTIDGIQDVYNKVFKPKLLQVLVHMYESNDPTFNYWISHKTVSQLIIFGENRDTLFIRHIGLTAYKVPGSINIRESLPNDTDYTYAGEIDEIKETLEKKNIWEHGIVKGIRQMITLASYYDSIRVGGKIDVVSYTKMNGLKWL